MLLLLMVPGQAVEKSPLDEARALLRASQLTAARTAYEDLLADPLFSRRREVMFGLGEILLVQRDAEALQALGDLAIKEFPDEPYAWAGRGAALAIKAQASRSHLVKWRYGADALRDSEEALTRDGHCALGLFLKGIINYHMPEFLGNLPDSVRAFEGVLSSLDPRRERVLLPTYQFLALALRRQRNTRGAVRILDQATFRFPQHKPFRQLLEYYRRDMERYPHANRQLVR